MILLWQGLCIYTRDVDPDTSNLDPDRDPGNHLNLDPDQDPRPCLAVSITVYQHTKYCL